MHGALIAAVSRSLVTCKAVDLQVVVFQTLASEFRLSIEFRLYGNCAGTTAKTQRLRGDGATDPRCAAGLLG